MVVAFIYSITLFFIIFNPISKGFIVKAAFITLGCKVNQYETQEMSEVLRNNGFEIISGTGESIGTADIFIINSCTVTAESDRKTRQAVRHYKKLYPESIIVLTGCMPQASPGEPPDLPEADIIMGNRNNIELLSNINCFLKERKRFINLCEHKSGDKFRGSGISAFDEHTRAFVKIQDGCDRFCSYCIIPVARGRSRSRNPEDIINECINLAGNGYKEIVLTGINLSAYGRETGTNIANIVTEISNIKDICRIRLGSLEPDHINDEVLNTLKNNEKFCPQFHISLQSGSDAVLKLMNRHYNTMFYRELAQKIREIPDASITTDIIVGFPQESEENFRESIDFVREIGFEKVHIFPYSERPGTRAAGMQGKISKKVKNERAEILAKVCEEIRKNYFESQTGKSFEVLFETPKDGKAFGYTKNYCPVLLEQGEAEQGSIKTVKITGTADDYCLGAR